MQQSIFLKSQPPEKKKIGKTGERRDCQKSLNQDAGMFTIPQKVIPTTESNRELRLKNFWRIGSARNAESARKISTRNNSCAENSKSRSWLNPERLDPSAE